MEDLANKYIRFDWAMKRLLRDKANFGVLEGFLTTLLNEEIKINKLLESESNQEDEFDKQNRVDLLAENDKGELFLIEVQNNSEYAYFQRMLFGTSKLVTEYINRGKGYGFIRKSSTRIHLIFAERLTLREEKDDSVNIDGGHFEIESILYGPGSEPGQYFFLPSPDILCKTRELCPGAFRQRVGMCRYSLRRHHRYAERKSSTS